MRFQIWLWKMANETFMIRLSKARRRLFCGFSAAFYRRTVFEPELFYGYGASPLAKVVFNSVVCDPKAKRKQRAGRVSLDQP